MMLFEILPILASADAAHDIKILKLQIKGLIKLQTDTNRKLSQVTQEVQSLKTKDETLNGYCRTKQNACGSCYCVEDFNIPEKYFCDCRAKPTRRDCKEHYMQGERTNGVYRISFNTYGMVVPVYCDQKTDGGWHFMLLYLYLLTVIIIFGLHTDVKLSTSYRSLFL